MRAVRLPRHRTACALPSKSATVRQHLRVLLLLRRATACAQKYDLLVLKANTSLRHPQRLVIACARLACSVQLGSSPMLSVAAQARAIAACVRRVHSRQLQAITHAPHASVVLPDNSAKDAPSQVKAYASPALRENSKLLKAITRVRVMRVLHARQASTEWVVLALVEASALRASVARSSSRRVPGIQVLYLPALRKRKAACPLLRK